MNSNKLAEIRKLAEQGRETGNRPHYDKEVKVLAKALFKSGVTHSELANATGICRATLVNWEKENRKNKFRELKAVDGPEDRQIQLKIVLPNGVVIVVLDVSLLKSILEQCS